MRMKPNFPSANSGFNAEFKSVQQVASPQADWLQEDETKLDYIKNKPNIAEIEEKIDEANELIESIKTAAEETKKDLSRVPGQKTENGGEIFNDYVNNKAISQNATTFGYNNLAGLRGFEITSWENNGDGTGFYTLSKALPEEIKIGTLFSAQISKNYYNYGSITSISEDRTTIHVDKYIDVSPSSALNVLWFTDYPEIGDIDLGLNAFVGGSNNQAIQDGAVSFGKNNKTIGKYGATFGKDNVAYYAAFAGGTNNKALNERTFTFGAKNEATGLNSTTFGYGNKATAENQFVLGRYNKEDPDSVFIVAYGKLNEEKNMLTVKRDGGVCADFVPVNKDHLTNKGYVDSIVVPVAEKVKEVDTTVESIEDRLTNFEEGCITLDNNTSVVTLPEEANESIFINKIGGSTLEGLNKADPKNLVEGTISSGKVVSTISVNGDNISVTYLNKPSASFAFGLWLDVKPNTVYRVSLDRLDSSITAVYFYKDKLFGTSALSAISFKHPWNEPVEGQNSLTFNSGENSRLLLGFYSPKGYEYTNFDDNGYPIETVSNLMVTEGEGGYDFVRYTRNPSPIHSIQSRSNDGKILEEYSVPQGIIELPGYGYSDSIVNFKEQTYSYVTTNGIDILEEPVVINVSNIIAEAPELRAGTKGYIEFLMDVADYVDEKDIEIFSSFYYKPKYVTKKYVDDLIVSLEKRISTLEENQIPDNREVAY